MKVNVFAQLRTTIVTKIKINKAQKPDTKILSFIAIQTGRLHNIARRKIIFTICFLRNWISSILPGPLQKAGMVKVLRMASGGCSIKRALDRHVSYGNDITNGIEAHEVLTKRMKTVKCFYIKDAEVDNIKKKTE